MEKLLAFRTVKPKTHSNLSKKKSNVQETITVKTFDMRVDIEMSANNHSGFVGLLAAIIVCFWIVASLFRRREKKMMDGQILTESTNLNFSNRHIKTCNYSLK